MKEKGTSSIQRHKLSSSSSKLCKQANALWSIQIIQWPRWVSNAQKNIRGEKGRSTTVWEGSFVSARPVLSTPPTTEEDEAEEDEEFPRGPNRRGHLSRAKHSQRKSDLHSCLQNREQLPRLQTSATWSRRKYRIHERNSIQQREKKKTQKTEVTERAYWTCCRLVAILRATSSGRELQRSSASCVISPPFYERKINRCYREIQMNSLCPCGHGDASGMLKSSRQWIL